jgi:hypothetical protein
MNKKFKIINNKFIKIFTLNLKICKKLKIFNLSPYFNGEQTIIKN